MDRIATLRILLNKIRQVTEMHGKYLSHERDYFEGERLYMREAHLILAVGRAGEAAMSELAQALEVTPGAVSQLARRIEAKGFIQRVPSQLDRRVNIVRLTERGEAFCRAHSAYDEAQYSRVAEFLSAYSQEELERFIAFEEKLEQMFQIADQEEKGSEESEL